jgi:hypothetical protein
MKMMDEIKDEIREEIRKEFQKDWEKELEKNPGCDPESWWEERRLGMKIFLGALMGLGIIALIFLFGWFVMLLWNWLMPEIFGLKTLNYWQAWGLLILSSILFKDMPSGGSDSCGKTERKRKRELRKLVDEEIIRPEQPPETETASVPDENRETGREEP